MYTKFNHRPEQKFAFQRKPKIRVLTKFGFQELMNGNSNPVQFQDQGMMNLDPFTKKIRPQISLREKFLQVENAPLEEKEELAQENYKEIVKDHPYILQNHAFPLQEEYKQPREIYEFFSAREQKFKAPQQFESQLFTGARASVQQRKQQRLEPLRLAGSLSFKHFNDLHPAYEGIINKLNRAVNFDNNQFKFKNE